MPTAVLRILDANANRAAEGLRVLEEYARLVLESPDLSACAKQLRHDVRAAVAALAATGGRQLEAARDIDGDVGTAISVTGETLRADGAEVARASCKRVQEGLRVLDEYGKVLAGGAAAGFEQLRYRCYALESRLLADPARRQRLGRARLYVLVSGALASSDALTACREAVAGGADMIQMREKDLEDGEFLDLALGMREICAQGGALFLVNDRPHIAGLTRADGVHTGWGDLPVHLCRRFLGHDRIVGRSTCSPGQALRAREQGADYIGVGPVYPTRTKVHRAAVGLDYVRYAAAHARLPFFCIGSINRGTLESVLEAGARAVAVCTAVIGARDIAGEAAWFKRRLEERASLDA